MIEQFFWPKTDWQQPRAGSLENQAHSRKQGMPEEAGTWSLHAPGRGEPLLEHRTLVSCPFLGFPTRPCVKASGEGKDPA